MKYTVANLNDVKDRIWSDNTEEAMAWLEKIATGHRRNTGIKDSKPPG